MANTKALTREKRKEVKRATRKEFKKLRATLTPKDLRAIRKAEEPIGVKHYLAMKERKSDGD